MAGWFSEHSDCGAIEHFSDPKPVYSGKSTTSQAPEKIRDSLQNRVTKTVG
jgi:hypothetical protein